MDKLSFILTTWLPSSTNLYTDRNTEEKVKGVIYFSSTTGTRVRDCGVHSQPGLFQYSHTSSSSIAPCGWARTVDAAGWLAHMNTERGLERVRFSVARLIVLWDDFSEDFEALCWSPDTAGLKNLPANTRDCIRSLGQEEPLQEEMATHSNNFACKILWTEEPGGLQSMTLKRVVHDWASTCCLLSSQCGMRQHLEQRMADVGRDLFKSFWA